MAQRVVFPVLPGVPEQLYLVKLNKLLYFIDENRPKLRELRMFMQEEDMWDRSAMTDEFWEFYGIQKAKRFRLTKFGIKILDLRTDPDEQKEAFFKYIVRENEILARYVFDALTERLHSDAELYRYITSYVYPGKLIRRPEFINWLKLVSVLEYIRILGIRWALTERGQEAMKWIEKIDVESILEEERMEEEGEEEDEEDEDDETPEELAARLERVRRRREEDAAMAAKDDAEGEDEDDEGEVDGGMEEPYEDEEEAPYQDEDYEEGDEAPYQGALEPHEDEATPEEEPEEEVEARPAAARRPAGGALPSPRRKVARAPRPAARVVTDLPEQVAMLPIPGGERPLSAQLVTENLERLVAWWTEFGERELRRAEDFGLGAMQYDMEPQVFFLKVLSLSRLVITDPRPTDRWGFFNKLERARFFPLLVKDPSQAYGALEESGTFTEGPRARVPGEHLFEIMRFRHVLVGSEGLLDELGAMEDPATLVGRLSELFFDGRPSLEAHWIVREMFTMGLWRHEALRAGCPVPSASTRRMAHRLGLLPSPYASSARDLLDAAARISEFLGPEVGFDEPLHHLAKHLGCRESCPHKAGCPYNCREKLDL